MKPRLQKSWAGLRRALPWRLLNQRGDLRTVLNAGLYRSILSEQAFATIKIVGYTTAPLCCSYPQEL